MKKKYTHLVWLLIAAFALNMPGTLMAPPYWCWPRTHQQKLKPEEWSWTALHLAANYGHTEMVAFLLSNGADPSIRTHTGKTPIELAKTEPIRKLIRDEIARRAATDTE